MKFLLIFFVFCLYLRTSKLLCTIVYFCAFVQTFVHKSNLGELTELNFDRTFDELLSLVQNVMEKHAPLKRLSRKQQKLKSKPWITKEIYAMICRKNKMHKSHYILGNDDMKQEYKSYSNKLTKIKALAKKEYYSAEIEKKNKTNQRKTWELLRTLLPGNSKKKKHLAYNCKCG